VAKTPTSKKLKARWLMVEAAMDCTKMQTKMRRACRLVLVYDMRPVVAAKRIGVMRQDLHIALIRVRLKLALVEAYAAEIA
jgi:predicted DNA-binding protein (UPF0251 family)